jgi:hypothetical protein
MADLSALVDNHKCGDCWGSTLVCAETQTLLTSRPISTAHGKLPMGLKLRSISVPTIRFRQHFFRKSSPANSLAVAAWSRGRLTRVLVRDAPCEMPAERASRTKGTPPRLWQMGFPTIYRSDPVYRS